MRSTTLLCALLFAAHALHANTLTISGESGEYVSGGSTYSFTDTDGAFTIIQQFDGAITIGFQQRSAPFNNFTLTFEPYPNPRLDAGNYLNASRWPFNFNRPGLDVTGNGRGCNVSSGSFQVLSSQLSSTGLPLRLHIRFEQLCDINPARLTGELIIEPPGAPAMSGVFRLILVVTLALAGALLVRSAT